LIEIPEEVEVEDNLGPVEEVTHQVVDNNNEKVVIGEEEVVVGQTFDVEVDGIEDLSENSGTADESVDASSSEESDYNVIITTNKRTRTQNLMIGSVKKGKYSKNSSIK
jgi:hypothetical protein